jgi:exonuclease VII small subunit
MTALEAAAAAYQAAAAYLGEANEVLARASLAYHDAREAADAAQRAVFTAENNLHAAARGEAVNEKEPAK